MQRTGNPAHAPQYHVMKQNGTNPFADRKVADEAANDETL